MHAWENNTTRVSNFVDKLLKKDRATVFITFKCNPSLDITNSPICMRSSFFPLMLNELTALGRHTGRECTLYTASDLISLSKKVACAQYLKCNFLSSGREDGCFLQSKSVHCFCCEKRFCSGISWSILSDRFVHCKLSLLLLIACRTKRFITFDFRLFVRTFMLRSFVLCVITCLFTPFIYVISNPSFMVCSCIFIYFSSLWIITQALSQQTNEGFPFLVSVKEGWPTYDELEELSGEIEFWKPLGRRLNFTDAQLTAFHKDNVEWLETAYAMLRAWKRREGSAGSYRVLYEALCHSLVGERDLAEKLCCYSGWKLWFKKFLLRCNIYSLYLTKLTFSSYKMKNVLRILYILYICESHENCLYTNLTKLYFPVNNVEVFK